MSFPPQPAFPESAFPSAGFPQQQSQWATPQQQTQSHANANDFAFYSPPVQQQQQQPAQHQSYGQQTYAGAAMHQQHAHSSSPPQQQQQQHAEGWNSSTGARMRPGMAAAADPNNGQVAFMPAQLMSNPMAGMAFDYGKASFAKNLSWVMSFLSALKYYFHVNNRYVVAKLRVLLLPFMHQNWKRERLDSPLMATGGAGGGAAGNMPLMVRGDSGGAVAADDASMMAAGVPMFKAPRDDINAPDLYIPTMAFVTFILAMGYALGTAGQFHPEVLGITASRSLVLLFFEVLGLKAGLYLISVGPTVAPPSLLDLIAYASYKYVHCILMIVVGLLLGSVPFYVSIVLLGGIGALFMMRTMKRVCTPAHGAGVSIGGEQGAAAIHGGFNLGNGNSFGQGKHRRNYFLLLVGAVQILFSWFLVRTANQGF